MGRQYITMTRQQYEAREQTERDFKAARWKIAVLEKQLTEACEKTAAVEKMRLMENAQAAGFDEGVRCVLQELMRK